MRPEDIEVDGAEIQQAEAGLAAAAKNLAAAGGMHDGVANDCTIA